MSATPRRVPRLRTAIMLAFLALFFLPVLTRATMDNLLKAHG